MLNTPLVTPEWVNAHIGEEDLIIADVRWYFEESGREAYLKGHLPSAIFFDLDDELADRSDLTRGRHPLPELKTFVELLARVGIGKQTKVVAYDDTFGSTAVRLWWMLKQLGHEKAFVLDGGITRWEAEGYSLEHGESKPVQRVKELLNFSEEWEGIVSRFELGAVVTGEIMLLDARAPERYRGEEEPIDFRAGHIPGAVNAPWANNLTQETPQVFRKPDELRKMYEKLGVTQDKQIVCYCGSGATACHNILALELAGFKNVRLYPGSWSEWIHHNP
ncbi:sulfurtransferase [bacterium]|nr:sulfurtransferase [bacterium]